jgi:hypothetical protein
MIQSGVNITKEEVKAVLDEQIPQQFFKAPQVRRKKDHGAITSLFPFECMQIDIFSLFNFINEWRFSPYKYAFCAIDVFTRKAFGVAMTKKTMDKTTEAFRTILEEINKKEYDEDDKEQDSPYYSWLDLCLSIGCSYTAG